MSQSDPYRREFLGACLTTVGASLMAPAVAADTEFHQRGQMTSEQNKQLVIEAWRVFASRDQVRISDLFTDDAEWIAPKGNATAVALHVTDHMIGGREIAFFIATVMHRLFQNIQIDFRGVFADGDTVIVEEHMRAEIPGGKIYDNDYCFVFELKEGKISRVREYMDTLRGKEIILG